MNDLQDWKTSYETCAKEMEAAIRRLYGPTWTAIISFQGAADQYIAELEQRVKDLEKIIGVINEPAGRDVTAELGHVRGLDMLQWLDSAESDDAITGANGALAGWRDYTPDMVDPLQALSDRGYVIVEPHTAGCHITDAGEKYLATLKREVFGK